MRKLFTILLFLSAQTLMANNTVTISKDSIPETKISWKFGGRLDIELFANTYKGLDSRNGLQYIAPARPDYNSSGVDVNNQAQLRMSAAPSRFNFTVNATNILGGNAKGFIEVDFMGVSENVFNSLRMRHVYVDLQWKTNSLLIGQTSHLTMIDEVTPNTVTYGGGYSINPLNRAPQIQFRQSLCQNSDLTVAATFFGGNTGTMQSYAMMPDLQVRFTSGNQSKFFWGVLAGARMIKPRVLNSDKENLNQTLTTFNAAAFAKYVFNGGYSVRLYGLWGEDLSPISILGGYAPVYSPSTDYAKDDYSYTAISAFSTFIDLESPISKKGWQWGIFAGWQKNLGANKEINSSLANIPNLGLQEYWRIAPRMYYVVNKNLCFGLEYMLSSAVWSNQTDDKYKPVGSVEVPRDHRFTFLARYRF